MNSNTLPRRFGVSVLTLFPFFLIPMIGFWLIARILEKAGMEIQLYPSRGLWLWALPKNLNVCSYEQAFSFEEWEDGKRPWFYQIRKIWELRFGLKLVDGYRPIFDLFLFPATKWRVDALLRGLRNRFPDAIAVDTPNPDAIEISPNRESLLESYVAQSKKLVVDLHHLRQLGLSTEMREAFIQSMLIRGRVAEIQIQSDREDSRELDEFFLGQKNKITEFLEAFRGYPEIPVVFEIDPRHFWGLCLFSRMNNRKLSWLGAAVFVLTTLRYRALIALGEE